MCQCICIEFGSYDNQATVLTPQGKKAGIDNCILPEIRLLWAQGVETIESCCGHNKATGYICVHPKDIYKMKELGYKQVPDVNGETRYDIFIPKTIKCQKYKNSWWYQYLFLLTFKDV